MLTIITTPKAFRGHIAVIQANAIQSWTLLRPKCEIILFGNEEGTAETAARFGIRHIPQVECNEYGTPLARCLLDIAQRIGTHDLMCYVNADIILMSDFLLAVRQIRWPSFLLVGQRLDIDINEPLDFNNPHWEAQLRDRLAKEGKLHGPRGLDYFVFPRGMYCDMPPLAIGRIGWDNWMVYRARSTKVPVIDGTKAITVIHQNHDYSHLPEGERGLREGPEAERNRELLGGPEYSLNTQHATWILAPQGMKRALTMRHLYFRISSIPVLFPQLRFLRTAKKALVWCARNVRARLRSLKEEK